MSAKNLKLKSSLCALLGFDALELKVGLNGLGSAGVSTDMMNMMKHALEIRQK